MTKLNGVKNAIMQVTFFLNGPTVNFSFYCLIILYWEKVNYYKKYSHNLKPEVQIMWRFQRFNAIDEASKWWKTTEFLKFQLKWKTRKHFTSPKQRVTLRKLFSTPYPQPTRHQIKTYYVSGTNSFLRRYTEIYIHSLSKCLRHAVLGCQEMVQCKCFFWHQTETYLLENF